MKKKIAILLPYKEKYTVNDAAAASIWVKDYLKISHLNNETVVFGNLPVKAIPLTSNFININLSKIKVTPIFKWLKTKKIKEMEMLKTFNCGVGFCLIANKSKIENNRWKRPRTG